MDDRASCLILLVADLHCGQSTTDSTRFKHINGDPGSKLLLQVICCGSATDASTNHSFKRDNA